MHFESVWMLHVLYTLLLLHTTMNKYITIAIPALTLIAVLPLQSHCSHYSRIVRITVALFAHTQEHGTLTHPRNELVIRKSRGSLAAIQTNYVILL